MLPGELPLPRHLTYLCCTVRSQLKGCFLREPFRSAEVGPHPTSQCICRSLLGPRHVRNFILARGVTAESARSKQTVSFTRAGTICVLEGAPCPPGTQQGTKQMLLDA